MPQSNTLWSRIYRRIRDEFFPPTHPFDQTTGVDTSGRINLRRLGIGSPNRKHGSDYHGVEPGRFADALADIPEDLSVYTFVDLGSGKGRALLMADKWGFRRIIGVEFSPKLVQVAQVNLKKLKLNNAEVLVRDAGEFRFPEEPLVVFMYNPFGPEVLKRVLDNLRIHPGPLYLTYVNPLQDETIRVHDSLQPLVPRSCGKMHTIWYREAAISHRPEMPPELLSDRLRTSAR